MAMIPNICSIQTAHVNGTPVTVVNQAIMSGRRYAPGLIYIETANALGEPVVLVNAVMLGFTYVPEPLVGATTVTVTVVEDDATGWTAGN